MSEATRVQTQIGMNLKDAHLKDMEPPKGFVASTLPPQIQKSEDLLLSYQNNDRLNWVTQATEDTEFEGGAQWTSKQVEVLKDMRMSPVAVNVLKPAISQAVAMLTSNSPRFQSTAFGDSDAKVNSLMSDLMQDTWHQSAGDFEFKLSINDYYVKGLGILHAFVDPMADFGLGQVFIRSVNPYHVYVDPDSSDIYWRDAAHILISEILTRERLLYLFPDHKDLILKAKRWAAEDEDQQTSTREHLEDQALAQVHSEASIHHRVIDRYSKDRLPFFHIYDRTSDTEFVLNEEELVEWRALEGYRIYSTSRVNPITIASDHERPIYKRIFESTGGVFHLDQNGEIVPGEETEGAIPGSTQIIEAVTLGEMADDGTLLSNRYLNSRIFRFLSVGDQEIFSGYMELEEYPLVPLMNHFSRNPYPMSDVRFVRGLQQYLNKTHSLIMAHVSNSTNVKVFVDQASTNIPELERKWSRAGAAILPIDFEGGAAAPVIAAPIPLPSALFATMAEKKKEIENILGIFAFAAGDVSAAPTTFKGTLALDEFGQRRIKSKRDDIEGALNQLGKVVIALIQDTYTEYKMVRLLQPNNQTKVIELNKPLFDPLSGEVISKLNDVTVGRHDMLVVSGSTLPSNRWAIADYYLDLKREGIIDRLEVLKKTDVADSEEVESRMNEVQLLVQSLQAAQDRIQELEGDMQTADRELRVADRQVEREKVKSQLRGEMANVKATSQLTQSRLTDKLKELDKAIGDLGTSQRATQ